LPGANILDIDAKGIVLAVTVVVPRVWKPNSDKAVYLSASWSVIKNEKITMTIIIIIILILLLGGGGGYYGYGRYGYGGGAGIGLGTILVILIIAYLLGFFR
jgi:hypothetical protein